jgi:hypothetical protein
MRYLVVSFLFLSACSQLGYQPPDPRTISGVNPVFQPYVDEYLSYKGYSLDYDIPIQFSDLEDLTAGLCTRWSTGERQIQIDEYHWNYMNEGQRINLIAHELGHCDLNRDHILDIRNGSPISIMYPYVFTLYPSTIINYMTELFNPTVSTSTASLASHIGCVKDIEVE